MRYSKPLFLSCLAVALLVGGVVPTARAAVMGLDLGSDTFKVALIRGKSFDIVLNGDSGRKTPTALSFDRQDVLRVGVDAKSLMTRFPKRTFTHLTDLLGHSAAPGDVSRAASLRDSHSLLTFSPGALASNRSGFFTAQEAGDIPASAAKPPTAPRFALALTRAIMGLGDEDEVASDGDSDEPLFAVEGALALIIQEARNMASKEAGGLVRDIVITIPPFWGQSQRQALTDAAEIAGVNVLGFISSPSAAAVQWGLPREFAKGEETYMVVYDMGDTSTKASVLMFKGIKPDTRGLAAQKKGSSATQMEVLSTAWDASLGGAYFDERIVNHWLSELRERGHDDLAKNARVMAKLYREARRTKEVLSANKEAYVSIEGLFDDFDFQTLLTREKFEELAADLFDRAATPLRAVIEEFVAGASERKINDLEAIEVVGGGSRVPAVAAKLESYLESAGRKQPSAEASSLLDRHLNGDEAAVMGATFHCANLSPGVRVTQFKVKDTIQYPVSVAIRSDDDSIKRQQKLFSKGSRLGGKKSLTLTTDEPLTVAVRAAGETHGDERVASLFRISGIPRVGEEKGDYNFTGKPKLTFAIRLKQTGTVVVENAEAEYQTEEWKRVLVKKVEPVKAAEENTEKESSGEEGAAESETEAASDTMEEVEVGSDDTAEAESETEVASDESADGSESTSEESTEDESTDEAADEAVDEAEDEPEYEMKRVEKVKRFPLSVDVLWTTGFSAADLLASKAAVRAIVDFRLEKQEQERVRNELETFVYSTQDRIEDSEWAPVTSAEQRESLAADLTQTGEWLYEDGQNAPAKEAAAKLEQLQARVKAIDLRVSEIEALPSELKLLNESVVLAEVYFSQLAVAEENADDKQESTPAAGEEQAETQATPSSESSESTAEGDAAAPTDEEAKKEEAPKVYKYEMAKTRKIKDAEIDKLLELAQETQAWADEESAKQAELEPHEEPTLLSRMVRAKREPIDRLVRRLLGRAERAPKKIPKVEIPDEEPQAAEPVSDDADTPPEDSPSGPETTTTSTSETETECEGNECENPAE